MGDENDYYINTSGSCSKEQAVAKLLGWSIGPLFKCKLHVSEAGIIESDLAWVENFEEGIDSQLQSMLADAQNRALEYSETDVSIEGADEHSENIDRLESLITQVHRFRVSIDDELAKGAESELRLDARRTSEQGEEYITLMSLDLWAQKHHGRSALPPKSATEAPPPQGETAERENFEDGSTDSQMTQLMIAVSLLATVVAELGVEKYRHPDGRVNLHALAVRMSEVAKNKGIERQGIEKLRKSLSKAAKVSLQEASVKAARRS